MSDTSETDKKPCYHHGDLRAALIDAALEMVDEEGMAGLSIRGLARRVGVTHSAPYRHFDDKGALIAAMAEEGFKKLHSCMLEAVAEQSDAASRFFASGLAYVRFAVDHTPMFRVMFCAQVRDRGRYPALADAHAGAYRLLVELIEECQQVGLIHAGPSEGPATAAWALVQGLSSLFANGMFDSSDPEHVRTTFQKCGTELLMGLAPRDSDLFGG